MAIRGKSDIGIEVFTGVEKRFKDIVPSERDCGFCSLRLVDERGETISVRRGVLQPIHEDIDVGAMITVFHDGGLGYAATADLSTSGLKAALDRARRWARNTAKATVDWGDLTMGHPTGEYTTPVEEPWESVELAAKIELLQSQAARLKTSDRIVDWEATLWRVRTESLLLTNGGGRVHQELHMLSPMLSVTANQGAITQNRGTNAFDHSHQGGFEVLGRIGFDERAPQLTDEVLKLLKAPNCPSGQMDLVLAADQMFLQIHESIGHPLELDRILGDERNYAGTSFVTLDMLGSYQYGSPLLNVSFDPTREGEFASYGFDDDGERAERVLIIENGKLLRPLGGAVSRARAGLPASLGTANSRATSWNRPPIDRMANLNLEVGESSLEQLIAGVERGVYMKTNRSWSIDDSRNKFQFGCELGQLIENGKLTEVVRNPNYRGISATFWRNLAAVGDASTHEMLGAPYCGKGEPNQIIRVGHASPACRFSAVDVFGGE